LSETDQFERGLRPRMSGRRGAVVNTKIKPRVKAIRPLDAVRDGRNRRSGALEQDLTGPNRILVPDSG
jgi:hypothetical protein